MNNYNRQSNSLIYEQYMKAFNSNNKNTHHNSYEKYFPPSNNNSVILPNIGIQIKKNLYSSLHMKIS